MSDITLRLSAPPPISHIVIFLANPTPPPLVSDILFEWPLNAF